MTDLEVRFYLSPTHHLAYFAQDQEEADQMIYDLIDCGTDFFSTPENENNTNSYHINLSQLWFATVIDKSKANPKGEPA